MVNLPVLLAASKQTVEGVAADGTTQVVVRIVDSGSMEGDQVTFTLFNDQTPRTASKAIMLPEAVTVKVMAKLATGPNSRNAA